MTWLGENLASVWLWFSVGWGLYIAVLVVWIVLQKREPVATLSWILGLALLPVVGFIVYHFLGPQRIRRQRLRRIRSRAVVAEHRERLTDMPEYPTSTQLGHLATRSTGYEATSCTRAQLLIGGERSFEALLKAVAGARHHVHLEYYIFDPDHTGTALRDALIERALAGVRVRLLVDAVGAKKLTRRFIAPFRAAGGEIAWFHPLHITQLWQPRWNMRSHRKIVVIDGNQAFTGGINITDQQDSRRSAAAYADLNIHLEGEIVRWLQLAFLEDWHYATGTALSDRQLWPELPAGPIHAHVLPSGPDNSWEPIHRLKVEAIHAAQSRVWLATPYFVPGEAALMALCSAAMRGVDVRLLVPERCDSRLVGAAGRSYYDTLLAAGVRVFEYRERMMHAKALLVDEALCLVGSANFDHRSFRLNFELTVMFHDADLGAAIAEAFSDALEASREIHAPRRPGPLRAVGEAFARLLSPLL